jgi:hypothetical protein
VCASALESTSLSFKDHYLHGIVSNVGKAHVMDLDDIWKTFRKLVCYLGFRQAKNF